MKKIILISLVIISLAAYAANEKIVLTIVDDVNVPAEADKILDIPLLIGTDVRIESDGNITATTNLSQFETELVAIGISSGNPPTISSFTCTSGTDCQNVTTDSTTITSTVGEDAVYCIENFNGSEVNTNINTNFISSTSYTTGIGGSYNVTCGNSFGETQYTETINLTAPPTVTLSANPISVASGGSSEINWSVANNPDDCTFVGDWPSGGQTNVSPTFYPSQFTIASITSSKTLSVTCGNGAGTSNVAQANISISGTSPSVWTQCSDGSTANLVLNGNEDRTIIANGTANSLSYTGRFDDFQNLPSTVYPWPGNVGESISLSLTRGAYMSAKFDSGNVSLKGVFQYVAPGNLQGGNTNERTTTISACPGEFDSPVGGQTNCRKPAGNLRWSTDPNANPAFYCMLDQNTEYYLNIVDSDNSEDNGYATSDCPFSYCGILAQYTVSTL